MRNLADALVERGHRTNRTMVGDLLRSMGFSLQANVKTKEGTAHPDRDAQFAYLNTVVKARLHAKQPVISVDTKKKELVGEFQNGGASCVLRATQWPSTSRLRHRAGSLEPYCVWTLRQHAGSRSSPTRHSELRVARSALVQPMAARATRPRPS